MKQDTNVSGKAMSPSKEQRLLKTLDDHSSPNRSLLIGLFVKTALLTGMRSSEILSLTWGQIDMKSRILTVGRAKTSSGTGRQIPINTDLLAVLTGHVRWFEHRFGFAAAHQFLFPIGAPMPSDPTRRITDITSAWHGLRRRAAVHSAGFTI